MGRRTHSRSSLLAAVDDSGVVGWWCHRRAWRLKLLPEPSKALGASLPCPLQAQRLQWDLWRPKGHLSSPALLRGYEEPSVN